MVLVDPPGEISFQCVEVGGNVDNENRERLKTRSPNQPRKTEEEKASEAWSWGNFIECALEDNWKGAEAEWRTEALKEAKEMGRTVKGVPLQVGIPSGS